MNDSHTTADLGAALAACSCPRQGHDSLAAPLCAADWYTGGEDGSLFLRPPLNSACSHLRDLPYGQFCLCRSRLKLYLNHGL